MNCTTFRPVLSRTASETSSNAGSGVKVHEEAISKEILSTRVQYTVLIFVPSSANFPGTRVSVDCVVQFIDTRQTL